MVCDDHDYVWVGEYVPQSEQEVLFQYDPEFGAERGWDWNQNMGSDGVHVSEPGDQSKDYDVMLAELVQQSGIFNFAGPKIPVTSGWNTDLFSQLLSGYGDAQVIQFLKYGWPVDRNANCTLSTAVPQNHKGAQDYLEAIEEFINDGLRNNFISGPYDKPPMDGFVTSPLNLRSKRASTQRRILMDLSWPQDGTSVNAGLDKNYYLGQHVRLRYPTVQTLVQRIKKLGPGCLMFKRDLAKSFYQLPLCPSAYRLIGFVWRNKYYFKKVMPMGLTCACLAMQRTSAAIGYAMNAMGFYLCPYVDDLAGCEEEQKAWQAYSCLGRVLRDIGAIESPEKAVEPTTHMEFLGNDLDSHDLTISVTPTRLEELNGELSAWQETTWVSRKQLESIIGKLQFCCQCIRSGRLFLNRLLNFLRRMKRGPVYKIPQEAQADLKWWKIYLPLFPSKSLMWMEQFEEADELVASDASLLGAGGVWFPGKQYYRCQFPDHVKEGSSICHLELWALIVSLKIWSPVLKDKSVVFNCDNLAVVELVNSGRAKDHKLQKGLRQVCFLAATGGFEILTKHISGSANRIPDLLSRWSLGEQYRIEFRKTVVGFTRRSVRQSLFSYSHDW